MNVEQWFAIAGVAMTLIGWFVRLERRFGKTLTREEHDRICMERNERVEKKLDSIEDGITGTHKRIDTLYGDLMRDRPRGG